MQNWGKGRQVEEWCKGAFAIFQLPVSSRLLSCIPESLEEAACYSDKKQELWSLIAMVQIQPHCTLIV